jgi:hypothetical protein
MCSPVTAVAQGDQILFGVGPGVTPVLLVMDL